MYENLIIVLTTKLMFYDFNTKKENLNSAESFSYHLTTYFICET